MVKRKTSKLRAPSAEAADQPATRRMLALVRDELRSDIRSVNLNLESSKSEVKSQLAEMRSQLSRMELLFEEQNANNRIALEGHQAVWQRLNRIEERQLS